MMRFSAAIAEVGGDAFPDFGEERAVERPFGDIDRGGAIAGSDRRHHQIASFREPFSGVAEFDQRKEAAVGRVERNAVVHDHQREGAVADRADQISEHRQRQREGPDLLLDADIFLGVRRSEQTGQEEQRRRY
jgi:hypothetical protein